MNRIRLSPRLEALAALADGAGGLWDVGSDHGKLPASLVAAGRIPFAVASDLRSGPLESAVRTARSLGVEARMRFVLCDGLEAPLPEGIDTIVVAGMGGETIAGILERAPWTSQRGLRLLLQPMSSAEELREFLYSHHYSVTAEHLVRERDKIYLILDVRDGDPEAFDLADARVGKHLRCHPLFAEYAAREIRRLEKELAGAGREREEEIRTAMVRIREYIRQI